MATDDSRSGVERLAEFLDSQGISYEVVEHPARSTAAADARAAGFLPHDAAKTVVLRDADAFRIAVIPASERLDLRKLRDLLDTGDSLRLASEEEIAREFDGFEVGALPPFAPPLPAAEIVDRRLLDHDRVFCSGGDHRHGLLVSPQDIVRIGHPQLADVCQD
jgi:Ala-tRNA(Pro) deacylase